MRQPQFVAKSKLKIRFYIAEYVKVKIRKLHIFEEGGDLF